jgi:hypothetical protein
MAAAAMKTAALTAETRMTAMAAMALVTIALFTLTIPYFVTRHVIANAITRVVAIAIEFVSVP